MMLRRVLLLCCLIGSAALLMSCQHKSAKQRAIDDARAYVKQVEKLSQIDQPISTDIVDVKPIIYEVGHLRDPFEVAMQAEKNKKYPDTILKNIALDSLQLIGIVQHDTQSWAIFRSNTGQIYKITQGTRVGIQHSLLTHIGTNAVKFIQEVDTASGLERREIVVQLQSAGK